MQQTFDLMMLGVALLVPSGLLVAWLAAEVRERHSSRRAYPQVLSSRAPLQLQEPAAPASVASRAPNDVEKFDQAA